MHKHTLCKYLLGGRVTLGERAFGQILTLSDHPSCTVSVFGQDLLNEVVEHFLLKHSKNFLKDLIH